MKIGLSVFLTCLILTFLSCTKNKDENVYENGIYKPYKQARLTYFSNDPVDGL